MALPRARGLYLSFGSYESRFLQTRCGVGRRRVQFYGIAYRYLFAYQHSLGILISIEDKTKDKIHVRILADSGRAGHGHGHASHRVPEPE